MVELKNIFLAPRSNETSHSHFKSTIANGIPYDDIKELIEEIWDLWGEHGKNRERVGELILRAGGMGRFAEEIGLEIVPEMVAHPRENPYIFFDLDKEEE